MRIISGSRRGLHLHAFKSCSIRPTSDSTKETIFNILGNVRDCSVLDLFAGTGSLGIEALSRGAAKALFVESSQEAQRILIRNLEKARFFDDAKLIRIPVERAFHNIANKGDFDIIFADPPYQKKLAENTLTRVASHQLLAERGRFVVEHPAGEVLPDQVENLALYLYKSFGETRVSFYQNAES